MLSCVRISLEKAFLMQKVNFGEFHGAVWISSSLLSLFSDSYYTPPEDSRGQGKREKQAASVVSLS